MKKKILSVILAIFLFVPCMFMFTACGGNGDDNGNNNHTHEWSQTYTSDSSQHWRICSQCGEENRQNHEYGDGYTCDICGYVNESLKPGEPQSMSTYFSAMKTKYARQNILDADKSSKSFDQILDNQIDMLARDILYRLNYVYGSDGTNSYVRPKNDVYDLNYALNGAEALVKSSTLLSTTKNTQHSLTNLKANCIDCYQMSLVDDSTDSENLFNDELNIKFLGATIGQYTTLQKFRLKADAINENAWNYYKQFNDIQSANAKAYLKYGIAQILAGKTIGPSYSVSEYTNALNSIETLGFNANIKSNLEKFIYNYIIGSELTTKDMKIYNSAYFNSNNYTVDNNFMVNAPYPGNTNYSDAENENSPRLYKGYNIVVPAIVKQALSNTFEGTTQTIYPTMSRYATDYNSNVFTTSTSNFDSIVLAPRTGTPATKLVVKIEGTGNNVELTIGCSVNGSNASSNQKKVRLSASGETVEFDLHSYSTIGSYNGGLDSDKDLDLFATNNTAKNTTNGTNYIKLVFTNPNNAEFKVTFTGYYNKQTNEKYSRQRLYFLSLGGTIKVIRLKYLKRI